MTKLFVYTENQCHIFQETEIGEIEDIQFQVFKTYAQLYIENQRYRLSLGKSKEFKQIRFLLVNQNQKWKACHIDSCVTMGRHISNTICIDNEHVSSQHLRIVVENQNEITICDLDSTNGTYINGTKIKEEKVEVGQSVILACVEIIVFPFMILCKDLEISERVEWKVSQLEQDEELFNHHDEIQFDQPLIHCELDCPRVQSTDQNISLFQSIGSSIMIFLSGLISSSVLFFTSSSHNAMFPMILSNCSMAIAFLLFGLYNYRKNKQDAYIRYKKEKRIYQKYLKEQEKWIWEQHHKLLSTYQQMKEMCFSLTKENYGVKHPILLAESYRPWISISHAKVGYESREDECVYWLNQLVSIQDQNIMTPVFWQTKQWVVLKDCNAITAQWLFLQFVWQHPNKNQKWIWVGKDLQPNNRIFSFFQCQSHGKRLLIRRKEDISMLKEWIIRYPDAYVITFEDWPVDIELRDYRLCWINGKEKSCFHEKLSALYMEKLDFDQKYRALLKIQESVDSKSFLDSIEGFSYEKYEYKPQKKVNLKVPIGVDFQNTIVYLDLHDSQQGPHGLIAGMTGSGKSEWLSAFLLELVLHNDSDYFQYILIDFKGGAFGQHFYEFSHCAGMITNMETNQMERFFLSLDSELQVRQKSMEQVLSKHVGKTFHIDTYNQYAQTPMSHLLIVVDEFAQLKSKHPEYMEHLKEVARIGRSLGIHLLLATQKPLGVIDDQIESNATYRLCFKVNSKSDSQEVLKNDSAYHLDEVGEFIFQVGNEHQARAKGFYLQQNINIQSCWFKEVDDYDQILFEYKENDESMIEYFSNKIKKKKKEHKWIILPDLSKYTKWENEMIRMDCPKTQQQPAIFVQLGKSYFIHYQKEEDIVNFITSILMSIPDIKKYVFGSMYFDPCVDQSFQRFEDIESIEGLMVIFLDKEQSISWIETNAFDPKVATIIVSKEVKRFILQLSMRCDYQLSLFDKEIDTIRIFFNQHALPLIQSNQNMGLIRYHQQLEIFYYPQREMKPLERNKCPLAVNYGLKLGIDLLSQESVYWKKERMLLICYVQQSLKENLENWLNTLEGIKVGKSIENNVDVVLVNVLYQEAFFQQPMYQHYLYDLDILWIGCGLSEYSYLIKKQLPMQREGNAILYTENEVRSFQFTCLKS